VCHTLGTLDPKLILNPGGVTLNSIALTGVLQARDCLQKYVGRQRGDACALNFLGLLFEQEGLLKPAEKTFARLAHQFTKSCLMYREAQRVLGHTQPAWLGLEPKLIISIQYNIAFIMYV